MRRADRLFQIVQVLRRGRLETAASLSQRLEVSERTIYRDMRDLMASGVPVEGEAGVGYILRQGYDLPPLMFSAEELEALVVGARLLQAAVGDKLQAAVISALDKIESALPEERRRELSESRLFVPGLSFDAQVGERLELLRQALNRHQVVAFDYVRADGTASRRTVQPLGLFFWGAVWTLGGWCEWRGSMRTFRVDRMEHLSLTDRRFEEGPGRSIDEYLAVARARRDYESP